MVRIDQLQKEQDRIRDIDTRTLHRPTESNPREFNMYLKFMHQSIGLEYVLKLSFWLQDRDFGRPNRSGVVGVSELLEPKP
jgi:hypothetical protein